MSAVPGAKGRGLRGAVSDKADETFTRVTAGIPWRDFRKMLRGDDPERPNPRLKPHSESFWLHIKPTYYHESVTKIGHTFRLGILSTYLFVVEIITGLILMIWYAPTPERAYVDMVRILSNVPMGQLMRDVHRLAAEAMVIIVVLHMFRTFLTGSYKKPRQFTWVTGVILLIATLFLSFSGYLLPWDQLAFWAVTIGTSMVEASPTPPGLGFVGTALFNEPNWVGQFINLLLRGAPDIGAGGLLRFYLLHVFVLPLIVIFFFFIHYYKVVHFGISLPASEEEVGQDTANRVPADKRRYYLMDVAIDEIALIGLVTFILIAMSAFFYDAALEHVANPGKTPLHTTAPWYFFWLQGLLKIGDKIFWGLVVPGILIVLTFILPYIDYNPSRRGKDRRIALAAGFFFASSIMVLSYMGLPLYAVESPPAEEVVQEFMPEEGVGPVREIPWSDIEIGNYCTDKFVGSTPLSEFERVLLDFHERIASDEGLANGVGCIKVEATQPNLKRISFQIDYDDQLEGVRKQFIKAFYLHESSLYWEPFQF
ncbi:MAG: cytochrome bc complex cytochrome b subunit [Caldilineales bacterium]|nr:cytochrome bc complex cytochrome b subunit [Caldilineales bacterium]